MNMKQIARYLKLVLLDAVIINIAWLIAIYSFYDMHVPSEHLQRYARFWPVITVFTLAVYMGSRLYNRLWKYAGFDEFVRVIAATTISTFGLYGLSLIGYTIQSDPNIFLFRRWIYFYAWMVLSILTSVQRFLPRIIYQFGRHERRKAPQRRRAIIVGAGAAGSSTAKDLSLRGYTEGDAVALVDDDPAKAGMRIANVPVLSGIDRLAEHVHALDADDIIIALPSADQALMQRIVSAATPTGCRLLMVPGMQDVNGPRLGKLRDVRISDLLQRDEVTLDMDPIRQYLTGKVVLVTGGGGSIGSELCRQIARFRPRRLIVFDIYENNAYDLQQELRCDDPSLELHVLIGSVRDVKRLDDVFAAWRPDVVFHAAAHKHVPLMEDSPAEAVKNNVFGTWNVAQAADKYGVSRMVQISTDKAVNPTNVMGATKRVTELIIQYMARHSKTKYMAVRFGNVLGSNGSVIPLFKRQIERGGPVTVTHPDITRYFMTIPEAAQLVLQAGGFGETGRIFVLDMGSPVRIVDLATNLIQLAGFRPGIDMKIEFCGLRPGEKLFEELSMTEDKEQIDKTSHAKIMVMRPTAFDDKAFVRELDALRAAVASRPEAIREPLRALVPTFAPREEETEVGA